jgi:hypothetical protein
LDLDAAAVPRLPHTGGELTQIHTNSAEEPKEIAERLGISITTVVTHVSHIYDKLNVKNAPAAVAKAFQMGILPLGKVD